MSSLVTRTIDHERNALAIKRLIGCAKAAAERGNTTQAVYLLEACEAMPVGPDEIRTGIARELGQRPLKDNPHRRIRDLVETIRSNWLTVWRNGNVTVDPVLDIGAEPLANEPTLIGDAILIKYSIPASHGVTGGTAATVTDILDERRIVIVTDQGSRLTVPRKYTVPCRRNVRSIRDHAIVTWLREEIARCPEEKEQSFLNQVQRALARQGITRPEHMDTVDETTIRTVFEEEPVAIMNMCIRAAVAARSSRKRQRSSQQAGYSRVEDIIRETKAARSSGGEGIFEMKSADRTCTKPANLGHEVQRRFETFEQAQKWFQDSVRRLQLNQLCDATVDAYASAIRSWGNFVDGLAILKGATIAHMPADPQLVAWWVSTFKNPGTAGNYLSALRKAHVWAEQPILWDHEVCKRIVAGHMRIDPPDHRPRPALRRNDTKKLALHFSQSRDLVMCDLVVVAYSTACRVKSEVIPAKERSQHSVWKISTNNTLRVILTRRKNRKEQSTITRRCECSVNALLCPHRAVERRIREARRMGNDQHLFPVSYTVATTRLRQALAACGYAAPDTFSFHAFRRGLARDLLSAKTPLQDILAACDWRSATFAWYIGREEIDAHATIAAAEALSDGERND